MRRRWGVRWTALGLAMVALAAAACGGGSKPATSSASSTASSAPAAARKGGTATFALQPGAAPNYIFPLTPLQYFTISNFDDFMYLMYRPLYWFGRGQEPVLNTQLSLAYPPQFTDGGRQVTIKLKSYRWSDGTPVTATDVAFWQNMVTAEKQNWAAYSPGNYPDNVVSFRVVNPKEIIFRLNRAYSSRWFTYNELSQITPLPPAWDKTSTGAKAGSGGCATDRAKCAAVYRFLSNQAKDLKAYATNPLWQVVDGPWHLTQFQTDGQSTFVPNPRYSGPVKPHLSRFELLPFTSQPAEYNVLRSGSTISVGYIPTADVPTKPAGLKPSQPGPNPVAANYVMAPWIGWTIEYFQYNYENASFGPVVHQLYFRQALQHLVDQPTMIRSSLKGYGYPTYGPVPTEPANPYVTPVERHNPYPYSIAAAKRLLQEHGWRVVPGGTDTCVRPGSGAHQCGAGIKAGAKLDFNLAYWSGIPWVQQGVEALKSAASEAGIVLNVTSGPAQAVFSREVRCKPTQADCSWQISEFNWLYAPDYYPTGGELWATGAGSNPGSYSDPRTDALIQRTHTDSSVSALKAYEDYLARDVPDLWWPNAVSQITEVAKNLHGVTPQNPLGALTPEAWYFSKS